MLSEVLPYLLLYIGCYIVQFVGYYLLPSGFFYLIFYCWPGDKWEEKRIQKRRPKAKDIRREFIFSLRSIAIFSLLAVFTLKGIQSGYSALYFNIHDYPLWYLPVSFFLILILQDTFYYWAHRFMHYQPVFPYLHKAHHQSITPTPWAIYSFQPGESLLQFLVLLAPLFIIPLNVYVFALILLYNGIVNAGGHTGYEFVPEKLSANWLLKYNNTVSHHDLHHSSFHYNYGLYFNIWDRLAGTFRESESPSGQK